MTIQEAIAKIEAGADLQTIASETGWPIIEDCIVPEPRKWRAADDSGCDIEVEADTADDAAQQYVDTGDWGDRNETQWITVRAWQTGIDSDGDFAKVGVERTKITLDPVEPDCAAGQEHDWQSPQAIVGGIKESPGVYGHGGGVTIQEVCIHCGCGKLTDTWAQDRNDGAQGLRSVTYEPGKYTDQVSKSENEDE